ncbi:heat shock protein transcriptional repressor HspR [Isoptericola variabilis]|uniref:Regulatory protein MerR n=1 Tax=Isoptericola variabilis (strain 225) TaxID=743718 RepID=F6FV45_ISOV2|nr:MerR family transcriptional regulator [Isoptericola variabilis]AEG45473.1 regulatory protein MerR [Isoptericola variabilis 225]TWH33839.1 MerR family transcriptional regulator/heat shock protein HspR [Isoptericola variabilis J7]
MTTDDAPVLTVSQAAELAGVHPQTLRQYDRLGIVVPRRTPGRGRRYSRRDVARLLEVQRLTQGEGINLAGIKRILDLEDHVSVLERQLAELLRIQAERDQAEGRVFAAGTGGEVVAVPLGRRVRRSELRVERQTRGGALVLWRPQRRG